MINQIGLTDARSMRPWRDTSEVYKAALARDYAEIVRGMRAYYVNWKPEYIKYVKIHYGWIKSGDWPRMAMVRALQQQAIYADPVVDDWPRSRRGRSSSAVRRTVRIIPAAPGASPRRCSAGNCTSFRTLVTTRSSRPRNCCIRRSFVF